MVEVAAGGGGGVVVVVVVIIIIVVVIIIIVFFLVVVVVVVVVVRCSLLICVCFPFLFGMMVEEPLTACGCFLIVVVVADDINGREKRSGEDGPTVEA